MAGDHRDEAVSAGKRVFWRVQRRLKVASLLLVLLCRCSVSLEMAAASPRHSRRGQDSGVAGHVAAEPRQVRWATAAHEYLLDVDCRRAAFSTERECSDLKRVDRHRWNVYLADPSTDLRRRMYSVLPDGPLGDSGRVDGVVVLDPYPEANFGHLVVVFHVTIAASVSWCQRRDGYLIGKQTSGCFCQIRMNVSYVLSRYRLFNNNL